MFDRFKGKDRTIVVGIPSFDDGAPYLLKTAESLALRTGMSLRLVHVIESTMFPYGLYPDAYFSPDLPYPRQDELEDMALKKLEALKRSVNPEVNLSTSAVFGRASSMLIAEAQLQRASLILCGVGLEDHKYIPTAFSTVLPLMSESPIPVLAVPNNVTHDFNKAALTIIVGDDLNDPSHTALNVASEIAISLGHVHTIHLHVHKQTRAELEKAAQQVVEGINKYQLEKDETYAPSQIFETMLEAIRHTMSSRLGALKVAVTQKGNTYKPIILFGDPVKQFAEAIGPIDPDIIVFGRHRWLHKQPFSLGKMPSYAMLNLHKPILSVNYAG